MPFTPFHFGPAVTIALIAKKYIDLPVFVLVNVVVDIEPLLVMLLRLPYPLHGYSHTFLIGVLIGVLFAGISYLNRGVIAKGMNILGLAYKISFKRMFISSLLGVWSHVLIDAFIYPDIRPFFPFLSNPLYGFISISKTYLVCALFFLPALSLYFQVKSSKQKKY